ncbi:MAG: DNA-directed DNA polymerase II small subunit [Candidatus Methanomethylicota archaeon]|uniref:DNA polymerase II small subunit n=1 Tax=Thermoproteota archaeon TaxID=2056631 RepID=A0A497F9V3_9CREN|nr:MAG: DNA-directed DNA polymerase II small subunit [Candidatus Verstraetearchaeota archaeon]
MNSMTSELRRAIAKILSTGLQISPDAVDALARRKDAFEVACKVIEKIGTLDEKPIVLTAELLFKLIQEEEAKREEEVIDAEKIPVDEEVIFDPTQVINPDGSSEGFISYFLSRYQKIKKILLRERFDVRNTITISQIKKWAQRGRGVVKIVCMVTDKRKTAGGKILLELEDPTGSIRAVVNEKDPNVLSKAEKVIRDEVLCIEGQLVGDIIIVSDIIQPEIPIPSIRARESKPRILAALISDLHVGSKYFMRSAFNRFLLWINGRLGVEKYRKLARQVKYLIIAGDIVDGIGVYPGQEKELLVRDIKKQYKMAAEYLAQIPGHIRIIIIPGNHDTTRQALPSPAIFRDYAEAIYKLPNVRVLGDPAYIKLHGALLLVTHGRSLDDILTTTPGVRYDRPAEVMIELLRRRHVAPVYGGRTQIAPEKEDYLVIDKIPDIFHAGHLHTFGYLNYRGVIVVNSGAWQEQTDYMKSMGIKPDPGKVTLVDLANKKVHALLDFARERSIEMLSSLNTL